MGRSALIINGTRHSDTTDFIATLFVFAFSPLCGLIIATRKVCYNLKYLYIIAGTISLFGAFLPPTSDAYRYRYQFLSTNSFTLELGRLFMSNSEKDFLFPLLSFISGKLGITFEVYKLVTIFICYALYCWMFCDIVRKNPRTYSNKYLLSLSIATMFLSVRLFTLVSGIRFGFASTIIIVAIYLISQNQKWKGAILFLVAVSMHFSMLMLVPICILGFLLRNTKINPFLIVLFLLTLIAFSSTAIGSLLTTLFPENELIGSKVDGYIEGKWGTNAMMGSFSIGGLVFTLIRILPVIPMLIYALDFNRSSFLRWTGLILCMLLSICFSSFTLLLRYSNIAIAVLFIWLLFTADYQRMLKKRLIVSFWIFLIVFSSYVYTQRKVLTNTYLEYAVVLSPAFLLIEHTYSNSWIYKHIDSDGELK